MIDKRKRFGDWESDTMVFRKRKPAVSAQHERKSMLLRLRKLSDQSSEETLEALRAAVESLLLKDLVKSMTFDNGGENVCRTKIRNECDIETYFCEPYKSWQKGGVENSNGLIRQYLPRTINLDNITEEMLYEIQEKLNNRPRKKLGYSTPNETINAYIINQQSVALNS